MLDVVLRCRRRSKSTGTRSQYASLFLVFTAVAEWVLYMGTTFALRQSEDTSPVSSEVLKIKVRIGAISIANCFRIIGLILLGPPALCGFKYCSNLIIPSAFTCISGISGYGPGSML